MCFSVYEVQMIPVSSTAIQRKLLLPVVEQFSSDTVQLSLTIDADLLDNNEQYTAIITTTSDAGSMNFFGIVEFSKPKINTLTVIKLKLN